MKKLIWPLFMAACLIGCKTQKKDITEVDPLRFSKTISSSELSDYLYTFSSDDFEGRDTGKDGQKKAAQYLKDYYSSLNIDGGSMEDEPYFQTIDSSYFDGRFPSSENVISMIKGSELPEEYLVITSHYDHVGIGEDGKIYNGADDDGSGTVA
ncbi:MAG: M28 family peptidase, partial [Psychroflexus sp.]